MPPIGQLRVPFFKSVDLEVVLADLALDMGLSHQMTSWPHNCFQGIVDLLRVFWWSGSQFGAPQNLAVRREMFAITAKYGALCLYC